MSHHILAHATDGDMDFINLDYFPVITSGYNKKKKYNYFELCSFYPSNSGGAKSLNIMPCMTIIENKHVSAYKQIVNYLQRDRTCGGHDYVQKLGPKPNIDEKK